MTPTDQSPAAPQKSWFAKNWVWLLLGVLGLSFACCGGLSAFTWFTAKKVVQSSGAYVSVMARTAMDPRIGEQLGEPVEPGLPSKSEVEDSGDTGAATFVIPMKGANKRGTVEVKGTKSGATWTWTQFDLVLEDGTRVDLKDEPSMDDLPPEPAMDEPQDDQPAPDDAQPLPPG